jgi:hypothetical protein
LGWLTWEIKGVSVEEKDWQTLLPGGGQ